MNDIATLSGRPANLNGAKKETKALTFRLDPEVHRQLKILAAQEGRTVTSIVTEGLNYMFNQRGLPPIA